MNHEGSESVNGKHMSKKTAPSLISNQLRDELIRILTAGDEANGGAFTIPIAMQVEKFVAAAREILMTENLAKNDLASLMMMRKQPYGGGISLVGSSLGYDGYGPTPIVPINNENFGVQAIRQLVEAARTASESPTKLVEALAVARSNGLADVAAALEKKLGVAKEDPVPDDDAMPESAFVSPVPTLPDGRPLQ